MSNQVLELFGRSTSYESKQPWRTIVRRQLCPFTGRKCIKVRKSRPEISIGTCSVSYRHDPKSVIICPFRLLERRQIFVDALHLLSLRKPGDELHVVPEVTIPGGSVDYFLVSVRHGKPVDFVGIELQALDTTGTVWPARQSFLQSVGVTAVERRRARHLTFGMNWKMTAKTALIQLHHKTDTFEHVSKHLLLVIQDCFLDYIRQTFSLAHLNEGRSEDSMQFHVYSLDQMGRVYRLRLVKRLSTDSAGISTALGLQESPSVDLEVILTDLEKKISDRTLWTPA